MEKKEILQTDDDDPAPKRLEERLARIAIDKNKDFTRYLLYKGTPPSDTDDVIQDMVFACLRYVKRKGLEQPNKLENLMWRVLKRQRQTHYKSKRKKNLIRQTPDGELQESLPFLQNVEMHNPDHIHWLDMSYEDVDMDAILLREQTLASLQTAQGRLDEQERAIIKHRYLTNPKTPFKQLSAMLGMTENACKMKATRTKRRLREIMEGEMEKRQYG